jgi:hypothetical protein
MSGFGVDAGSGGSAAADGATNNEIAAEVGRLDTADTRRPGEACRYLIGQFLCLGDSG